MPYDPATFHTDYSGAFSILPSSTGGDLAPFEAHEGDLQKTYSSAQEINADVDELQTNINSLIQSLGIDPAMFDATGNIQPSLDDAYSSGQDSFDFGSYLNGLDLASGGVGVGEAARQEEDDKDMESLRLVDKLDSTARPVGVETKMPTEQVHAFLDEVASQDGSIDLTASLMQTNQGANANATRSRKRKSDAADIGLSGAPETTASSTSGGRTKRKKDK